MTNLLIPDVDWKNSVLEVQSIISDINIIFVRVTISKESETILITWFLILNCGGSISVIAPQ